MASDPRVSELVGDPSQSLRFPFLDLVLDMQGEVLAHLDKSTLQALALCTKAYYEKFFDSDFFSSPLFVRDCIRRNYAELLKFRYAFLDRSTNLGISSASPEAAKSLFFLVRSYVTQMTTNSTPEMFKFLYDTWATATFDSIGSLKLDYLVVLAPAFYSREEILHLFASDKPPPTEDMWNTELRDRKMNFLIFGAYLARKYDLADELCASWEGKSVDPIRHALGAFYADDLPEFLKRLKLNFPDKSFVDQVMDVVGSSFRYKLKGDERRPQTILRYLLVESDFVGLSAKAVWSQDQTKPFIEILLLDVVSAWLHFDIFKDFVAKWGSLVDEQIDYPELLVRSLSRDNFKLALGLLESFRDKLEPLSSRDFCIYIISNEWITMANVAETEDENLSTWKALFEVFRHLIPSFHTKLGELLSQKEFERRRIDLFQGLFMAENPEVFDYVIAQGFPFKLSDLDVVLGKARRIKDVRWNSQLAVRITKLVIERGLSAIDTLRSFVWANPDYAEKLLSLYKGSISPLGKKEVIAQIELLELSKEYDLISFAEPGLGQIFESGNLPRPLWKYAERLKALLKD